MCNWGTSTAVLVRIPADLSYSGESRWDWKGIDSCIAPIVRALQEAGIDMRASCCGHGKGDGEIVLADGRTLQIVAGLAKGETMSEPHKDRFSVTEFLAALPKAWPEGVRFPDKIIKGSVANAETVSYYFDDPLPPQERDIFAAWLEASRMDDHNPLGSLPPEDVEK